MGKVTQKYLAAFEVQTCGDLLTHRGLLQVGRPPVPAARPSPAPCRTPAAARMCCPPRPTRARTPHHRRHACTPPHPTPLTQALFTANHSAFLARVALGLGATRHEAPPAEGEVGRKGISHERVSGGRPPRM